MEKTQESYNEDFCLILEFYLCSVFNNASEKEIRQLWCDGIDYEFHSRKYLNDNRQVKTKAWIVRHVSGDMQFEMTIKFGKYSLRRIAKGTDLTDCLPDAHTMNWIKLDIENKIIELQLK